MKKKPYIVGVLWTETGLRVCEASVHQRVVTSEREFSEPWPAAGSFQVGPTEVAQAFKRIVTTHGVHGTAVVIALPRHRYFQHMLKPGQPPSSELAREWLPASLDELYWHALGEPASLVAISKEWERQLTSAFRSVGFEVAAVTTVQSSALGALQSYIDGGGAWFLSRRSDRLGQVRSLVAHHVNALALASMILVGAGLFLGTRAERNILEVQAAQRRGRAETAQAARARLARFPARSVAELIEKVPAKLYLSQLSFDAAQNQLTLRGRAADYSVVSAFTGELTTRAGFKKIDNQKSALVDLGDRSVVDFSFVVPL
jgi:hypothetical protein